MPLPRPTRYVPKEEPSIPSVLSAHEKKGYRPSDIFRFEPKSDINEQELAYLVSVFWTLDVNLDRFLSFETDLQRHFRPVK